MDFTKLAYNFSNFAVFVRRSTAAVALTTIVIASASGASAGKIADLSSGAWTGGAFTNSHTGSFSHCAANAKYKSGIALYFSVTGKQQWSMAFASDHWEFQRGRTYAVRYQVDDGPVIEGIAVAKSKALVQMHLPVNGRMFSRFQKGGTLNVATNRKVMQFELTGAGPLLSKLYRCAMHHAREENTHHKVPVSEASFF